MPDSMVKTGFYKLKTGKTEPFQKISDYIIGVL